MKYGYFEIFLIIKYFLINRVYLIHGILVAKIIDKNISLVPQQSGSLKTDINDKLLGYHIYQCVSDINVSLVEVTLVDPSPKMKWQRY